MSASEDAEEARVAVEEPLLPEVVDNAPQAQPPIARNLGVHDLLLSRTVNLASHLPTGIVLVYYFLSPVLTNSGTCDGPYQILLCIFLAACTICCVLSALTDSFPVGEHRVGYGIASMSGICVFQSFCGSRTPPPPDAAEYRITWTDVAHAVMFPIIFVGVVVIDPKLLLCLRPDATTRETLLLKLLPVGVALGFSYWLTRYPTKRRGFGLLSYTA